MNIDQINQVLDELERMDGALLRSIAVDLEKDRVVVRFRAYCTVCDPKECWKILTIDASQSVIFGWEQSWRETYPVIDWPVEAKLVTSYTRLSSESQPIEENLRIPVTMIDFDPLHIDVNASISRYFIGGQKLTVTYETDRNQRGYLNRMVD